jgi:hypothetical protein
MSEVGRERRLHRQGSNPPCHSAPVRSAHIGTPRQSIFPEAPSTQHSQGCRADALLGWTRRAGRTRISLKEPRRISQSACQKSSLVDGMIGCEAPCGKQRLRLPLTARTSGAGSKNNTAGFPASKNPNPHHAASYRHLRSPSLSDTKEGFSQKSRINGYMRQ